MSITVTQTVNEISITATQNGTSIELQPTIIVNGTSLTLTTDGSSGAATLIGSTLNIPQYEGGASIDYEVKITASSTVLTASHLTGINRFESASAQTATLNGGVFSLNDEIYFTRTGEGTFELVKGTNVRLVGVRDIDNRFFINNKNSWIVAKYMELDGSIEVWEVIGRLKEGYTGAVTVASYTPNLGEGETKDITVIGTGFSSNMEDPVITGNITLNSWVYVSPTQITLNLTATGVETDTIDITYDNGDLFTDVDAITITNQVFLADSYPFTIGFALFQLDSAQTYALRVRRSSDDAETDVGFNSSYKVGLDSPVSAGGDLTTWAGSDDVFVVTRYNQGSGGSTYDTTQATTSLQPQFLDAGAMITLDTVNFIEFDGSTTKLENTTEVALADTDITVFSNVRLKSATGSQGIFNCFGSAGNRCFALRKETTGGFRWFVQSTTTLMVVTNTTVTVAADTNYRLAAYRNGTDINCYVDGAGATPVAVAGSYGTNDYYLSEGEYAAVYLNGYLNYNVLYESDQSANISAIETLLATFL